MGEEDQGVPSIVCPFLEELKDGKTNALKYKSKTLYFKHKPHVVVMMKYFPQKSLNEKGLANDRYTYLVIDKEGENGKWHHGFIDPTLHNTQNAYDTIQETIQTRLPNKLQHSLNRAFKSCFQENQQANAETICHALTKAVQTWSKTPFN